ncbi:unnamed protein product [Brugia timori]|uniref:Uncharacterized protein n=1 Tax=Brugia timori TaxID=42155 RepID=A0A0R3QKW1_9BILA|nr:unnamed protein product [Brugia timori]
MFISRDVFFPYSVVGPCMYVYCSPSFLLYRISNIITVIVQFK